ncbi:IclR family transcriptional regulator C-terminal domain-containing protein [Streptomyces sp. NPDC047980]|uniref:IclR family transcriptional regulator domain-containing protein n=1 Tax=Streptomyces sp. NPDC047980 TaxID=3365494 RepID=UPI00371AD9B3
MVSGCPQSWRRGRPDRSRPRSGSSPRLRGRPAPVRPAATRQPTTCVASPTSPRSVSRRSSAGSAAGTDLKALCTSSWCALQRKADCRLSALLSPRRAIAAYAQERGDDDIRTPADLRRVLAEVRCGDHAVGHQNRPWQVSTVAAPVRDGGEAVAALSVVAPGTGSPNPGYGPAVRATARAISRRLVEDGGRTMPVEAADGHRWRDRAGCRCAPRRSRPFLWCSRSSGGRVGGVW